MTQSRPHSTFRFQTTLKEKLTFSGPAVFSNAPSSVTLHPAKGNTGVVFLVGGVKIPARAEFARTQGSGFTTLFRDGKKVQMVEHLLSALYGFGIDNVAIEVDHLELPMLDGSALGYVEAFAQCGLDQLPERCEVSTLKEPVYFSEKGVTLVALPAENFCVSYTWHYPKSKAYTNLFYSEKLERSAYCKNIAPARTFAFYEDIAPAIEAGLIQGANLSQGVLIRDDKIVNREGLRFEDELVRHKVLDLIGDFSLTGVRINAHILAVRSGHEAHVKFAQRVRQLLTGEHTDGTIIRQANFGCESGRKDSSAQVSLSSRR